MNAGKTMIVAVAALAVAACSGGEKEKAGTVIGAGLGALAGAHVGKGPGKLFAVAVGTMAGAALGSEVGKSLDRADRLAMRRSTQGALEKNRTGAASEWRNPDSGNQGTVTPTRTYRTEAGRYCREYRQTITVGGRTEEGYGRACRQPDGSWRIVES
ncbi:MAG: RT0821/Lpp0805 family surface protein [Defluviicoccus sp.]|nr:RT0821/Lpp0805 family surface protein [Defluviicoccus sp.]MDE0277284.1 RT0821/Lpp0805 family surface protein [Defluviicoccus sp.]